MDKYVVDFEFAILFFDFCDLIALIEDYGGGSLKDYLPFLKHKRSEILSNKVQPKSLRVDLNTNIYIKSKGYSCVSGLEVGDFIMINDQFEKVREILYLNNLNGKICIFYGEDEGVEELQFSDTKTLVCKSNLIFVRNDMIKIPVTSVEKGDIISVDGEWVIIKDVFSELRKNEVSIVYQAK